VAETTCLLKRLPRLEILQFYPCLFFWIPSLGFRKIRWSLICLLSPYFHVWCAGLHFTQLLIQEVFLDSSWFWPREQRSMLWTTLDAPLWWLLLTVDRPMLLVCDRNIKCYCCSPYLGHLKTCWNHSKWLVRTGFDPQSPIQPFPTALYTSLLPFCTDHLLLHMKTPEKGFKCNSCCRCCLFFLHFRVLAAHSEARPDPGGC